MVRQKTLKAHSLSLEYPMAKLLLIPNLGVTGANTNTAMSALRLPANSVVIQARSDNGASVFIGDSANLNSATGAGYELKVGASLPIAPEMEPNGVNLADWYFASTSASAKINILVIEG